MAELLTSIFAGTLIALSLQTPHWFMTEADRTQSELDQVLITSDACRSDTSHPNARSFRFSKGEDLACPLRRMDFGAPDTRGRWPLALCTLLEASGQTAIQGGTSCAYQ